MKWLPSLSLISVSLQGDLEIGQLDLSDPHPPLDDDIIPDLDNVNELVRMTVLQISIVQQRFTANAGYSEIIGYLSHCAFLIDLKSYQYFLNENCTPNSSMTKYNR